MARKYIEFFEGKSFGVVRDMDENPNIINFRLHNHENIYEVLLLISGDCEFRVEGNSYNLREGDIVFVRPEELHRMAFRSQKAYERIILYIRSDYFKNNNCEKFLDVFENRELGTGNLISYDRTEPALKECMERLEKYAKAKEYDVVEGVVYEMLYLLNSHKDNAAEFYVKNERVRSIIMYINEHLSEELNLDSIANEFYIAKQYMCRVFKAATGYTVNGYITYKRILLVQELRRSGQTLIQASMNAGFNNYANFYKAYVKQTGKKPSAK